MEREFKSLNDCRPLLNLATALLYQRNAFRVAELDVDATPRDIARRAENLTQRFELEEEHGSTSRILPLRPPPTPSEIRTALDSLKHPELRLIHELFWFWPEEFGNSRADSAFQAWAAGDGEAALRIWSLKENDLKQGVCARHNTAVFWHLEALEREQELHLQDTNPSQWATIEEYWRMALKRWQRLSEDDAFWDVILMRIRQIADSRLNADFGRRLRVCLIEALGKIHLELALQHITDGQLVPALFHVDFMRRTVTAPTRLEPLVEPAMQSVWLRLRQLAREARQTASATPRNAVAKATQLIETAGPLLAITDFLNCGIIDRNRSEYWDETAASLEACADARQNIAPDAPQIVAFLKKAREIAQGDELIRRIDAKLDQQAARDRFRPIRDELETLRNSNIPVKARIEQIRDHILPSLTALASATPQSPAVVEIRERAALSLRDAALDASREKLGWDTALQAIDLALGVTLDANLANQLWADRKGVETLRTSGIETLRNEERKRVSAAFLDKMRAAGANTTLPKIAFEKIENDILPNLESVAPEMKDAAKDSVAAALRRLSIAAWNNYGDASTALRSIERAYSLAQAPDLARRIAAERAVAVELYRSQISRNLQTEIRGHRIEMSSEGIHFHETFLPTNDILGVRYCPREGAATNSRDAFRIEIKARGRDPVLIDSYHPFRGWKRIETDFEALTEALAALIAPRIIGRIATAILTQGTYPFYSGSPFDFTTTPTEPPMGILSADKLKFRQESGEAEISLDNLNARLDNKLLLIESAYSKATSIAWNLSEVWNAVFFKEIVASIERRKRISTDI
jgi:hypothetical protein